jgi:ribose transport system permease protein
MNNAQASIFFKRYGIYSALIVLMITFSLVSGVFFTTANLFNVARQVSMLGIAAVGMTFTLLLGGIDLSIGSMISLVNIVAAGLMVKNGLNPITACLFSILLTSILGFINGLVIANIGIPPLIVTLCSMTVLEGVAFIISRGLPIYGFPSAFSIVGQGYLGIVPVPVIIMVVVLAAGAFILNKTYFGRYFYAVGGNEEASYLSGIKVKNVKYLAYTLSGFFAGLAGIVLLSRTNTGQPIAGKGFEFEVLTAIVLGGVSVSGGYGKIANVVAGVCIIGVLSNGLVILNVSQYIQMVIKGMVLLTAVAFDCLQKDGKLFFTGKNLVKKDQ